MSSRLSLALLVLPMLVVLGVIVLWRTDAYGHRALDGSDRRHELMDDVIGLLEQHYDGPVEIKALVDGGLSGTAAAIGDRYTELWTPQVAHAQAERSEGKFGGIGVNIQRRPDGTLLIAGVNPDGPADRAGLVRRDLIVEVDGVSLKGVPADQVSAMVRGEIGTTVKLGIMRNEQRMDLVVVRDLIPVRTVEGARLLDGDGTGYVRIASFNKTTTEQFIAAWKMLKASGVRRLVLDLRDNPGGELDAAIDIADTFIAAPGVPIVSLKAKSPEKLKRLMEVEPDISGGKVYRSKDEQAMVDVPCVLLMNGGSASAAEVLAGCLQDHGLAFIIGERSYGKGVVQRTFALPSDPRYQLKITIARHFTPLGNNLAQRDDGGPGGIEPDLYLALSGEQNRELEMRFAVQGFQVPAHPDDIVDDEQRKAWLRPDPHLVAAQDYFAAKPVAMPLDPSR